ncbi:MAG: polysaccharide biosynthesis C-terminal domain-containing protein, partial [Rikenellaceae bacterium]|nr:polysaccharide biosynthesis C-terminal domain-containing protein [Rikenellaceae bacterium]
IFSSIQNETERLNRAYSKYIQFASAIVFPVMIGLIVLARPGVVVLHTDKWLPSVPLLQILALAWMLDHLSQINLNVLYVKGRSDLALRLEIIKKSIATALLIGSMFFGIYAIGWSRAVSRIIAVSLNTHYTRRLIGISRKEQFKDFMPYLLLAVAMGGCIHLVQLAIESDVLKLAVGLPFGVTCYVMLLYLFRPAFFKEFISLIKRR